MKIPSSEGIAAKQQGWVKRALQTVLKFDEGDVGAQDFVPLQRLEKTLFARLTIFGDVVSKPWQWDSHLLGFHPRPQQGETPCTPDESRDT